MNFVLNHAPGAGSFCGKFKYLPTIPNTSIFSLSVVNMCIIAYPI